MIDLDNAAFVDSHGQRLQLGAPVSALVWVGENAWFALGDGRIEVLAPDGSGQTIAAHPGAILCAAMHPDARSIITGGDDGLVLRTGSDGEKAELGRFERKWVEHVVASPHSGMIVAGVGREAVVWHSGASEARHRFAVPSSIGGLAIDAKGRRLCLAHYGGASMFYVNSADSRAVLLDWAGSHIGCTFAPDGRFVVTATQETGLHAWKLPDKADMAMSGYSGKTRSFSWSKRGKWLATSGDTKAIVWSFDGKDGPLGKRPTLLAPSNCLATRVAFHPRDEFLAVGYADGAVAIAQLSEDTFLPVQQSDGSAITALTWRGDGQLLAWGNEDGGGGMLDMRVRA